MWLYIVQLLYYNIHPSFSCNTVGCSSKLHTYTTVQLLYTMLLKWPNFITTTLS